MEAQEICDIFYIQKERRERAIHRFTNVWFRIPERMAMIFSRATKCQEREMPHIRNDVYTHPDRRCCQKERKGKRGRRSVSRTECNERDVSERESKRGVYGRARAFSRKCKGGFGENAVFETRARERAEDSEAGSRSMEVTWPAKPSGLSNFRLDTSRALATSLPRVARTPVRVSDPSPFRDFPSPFSRRFRFFFPG